MVLLEGFLNHKTQRMQLLFRTVQFGKRFQDFRFYLAPKETIKRNIVNSKDYCLKKKLLEFLLWLKYLSDAQQNHKKTTERLKG